MKSLMIIVFLSSSAIAQQEAGTRISTIAKTRVELESILDKKPYKEQEHTVIKAYFSGLHSLNEDLSSYSKYKKSMNNKMRSLGVESVCKELYLDKQRWNDLVKNCTKNNFFLCAEEVNDFDALKKAFAAHLDNDLKTTFDKTPHCK